MSYATVTGGGRLWIDLNNTELKLAQQALDTAAGNMAVNILTSLGTAPTAGDYNIYNIEATAGGNYTLGAGEQAIALEGKAAAKLTGIGAVTPDYILIGDGGKDTIKAYGGNGTIFSGDGGNVILVQQNANADIFTGLGHDSIYMQGGSATINPLGKDKIILQSGNNNVTALPPAHNANQTLTYVVQGGNDTITTAVSGGSRITVAGAGGLDVVVHGHAGDAVSVTSGANTINATGDVSYRVAGVGNTLDFTAAGGSDTVVGNVKIDLSHANTYSLVTSGNDTISFGTGSDTILAKGNSTINAGPGGVTVTSGAGNNSVVAGSGDATLIGGSGADTLQAGTGFTSIVGGSSKNVFVGMTGHDTLVGGAGADTFTFASTQAGGTHMIYNWQEGIDHIRLVGYSNPTGGQIALTNGGQDTTITLGSTTITLVGYHNGLNNSDFLH